MSSQDEVRNKLNEVISDRGIKARHICQMVGIYEPVLSRFRTGKKDLWQETLLRVEEYLRELEN